MTGEAYRRGGPDRGVDQVAATTGRGAAAPGSGVTVPHETDHPTTDRPATNGARLGRPRDAELTGRLLAGALHLVADHGLDRFNADVLAAATGAGKAAIYRRWPNTDQLLAEAVSGSRVVTPAADTGTLRGDLLAVLEPWSRDLDQDERAVAAVLGQAHHSPRLRAALETAVVAPLGAVVDTVLDQDAARGHEVPAHRRRMLRRLVLALWWERCTTAPAPVTGSAVAQLVDRLLLPSLRGD